MENSGEIVDGDDADKTEGGLVSFGTDNLGAPILFHMVSHTLKKLKLEVSGL